MNSGLPIPTVPTMTVACARCGSPASSVMSFSYAEASVWLDDLVDLGNAHAYPLCSDHADRMAPPHGWTLTDRRTVARLFAPVNVA